MTQPAGLLSPKQRNMLWGTITLGVVANTIYHGTLLIKRAHEKSIYTARNAAISDRTVQTETGAIQTLARAGITEHSEASLDILEKYFDKNSLLILIPLLDLDLTEEYGATHMMRDQAAATDSGADSSITQTTGHQHFDDEYGTTDLERLLTLRKQLPGKTMQAVLADPSINKAFVTQSFITLKTAMLAAIREGATTFTVPSSVDPKQVFRVPRYLNDLKANQWWLVEFFDLQMSPPAYEIQMSVLGFRTPPTNLPLETTERQAHEHLKITLSMSTFFAIWGTISHIPVFTDSNGGTNEYGMLMDIAMMCCAYLLIKTVLTR